MWHRQGPKIVLALRKPECGRDDERFLPFGRTTRCVEESPGRGRENKPPWPRLNFLLQFSLWGGKAPGKFSVVKESGAQAAPSRWAHPCWAVDGKIRRAARLPVALLSPQPLPLLHNLLTRLQWGPKRHFVGIDHEDAIPSLGVK